MKKDTLFAAVDVDDKAFHGAGIVRETGEVFEFRCKPDHGALRKKLRDLFGTCYEIRLCYEASYIGFGLCRFLRAHGIHCDIIAPSLIPRKTGVRVKTDRLDAAKLATYYATDGHIRWLRQRAKTLKRPVCQLTIGTATHSGGARPSTATVPL